MLVGKLLALSLFGAASVNAQMTNTTILGILNTTQLSPATKFLQLLTSSEDYKPILDLLSDPGNITVFVPSDKALAELQQKYNSSSSNGTRSSGGSRGNGSSDQSSNPEDSSPNGMGTAAYAILPENLKMLQQNNESSSSSGGDNNNNSTTGGSSSSSSNSTSSNNTVAQIFSHGPYKEYDILDILSYHIVNGSYMLTDLNHSSVLHTLLTNQTLDKNGIGMPIVVTNNGTGNSSSSQSSNSTSSSSEEGGGGGATSNSQATSGSFVILQDQGNNNSTSGGNSSSTNSTVTYKVGNGWDFANVTLHDIQALNGILHVIDDVLLPPKNLTATAKNISQISTLAQLAQKNQTITGMIQNATNITIFAPNNEALQSANLQSSVHVLEALREAAAPSQQQQEQIEQTVKAHIVQGVYYADNLTELATSNGTLPSLNSTQLNFTQVNATTLKVDNQSTIVKPNVLLDNGVLHIIDHVLPPPQQQQGTGQQQEGTGGDQNQGQEGQSSGGGTQQGGNGEQDQPQEGGQEGIAQ